MFDVKHEIKSSLFDIEFKLFKDGVWDGQLTRTPILSTDGYNAVAKLMTSLSTLPYAAEVEIVKVSNYMAENSNHDSLILGDSYTTLDGTRVKMMKVHNVGKDHETMSDQFGINRYSRRQGCVGRCTGSAINDPMSIKLGHSWFSKDFDHDEYLRSTGMYISRSDDKLSNFVDELGDGRFVTMNYRGYIIGRDEDQWFYCKPNDIKYKISCLNNSSARMRIDFILDGDDAMYSEEEIDELEAKL